MRDGQKQKKEEKKTGSLKMTSTIATLRVTCCAQTTAVKNNTCCPTEHTQATGPAERSLNNKAVLREHQELAAAHDHTHSVDSRFPPASAPPRTYLPAVERDAWLHASHAKLFGVVGGEEKQRLQLDRSVCSEVELKRG